jgi:hypothetical protein
MAAMAGISGLHGLRLALPLIELIYLLNFNIKSKNCQSYYPFRK